MTSSRAEELVRAPLRPLVGLTLISPYLIWLLKVPHWGAPDWARWAPVALANLTQASLATLGACALGALLFHGLRAVPAERRHAGELRLLLPNAVPPLFLALSLISLVTPFARFPFGLGAVVVAQALVNAGLVAVALERIERARLGHLAEVAWVMGVPQLTFWTRLAGPVIARELATLVFFVFTLAFTGFSLPLLLRGSRDLSLEVAAYDLIRLDGRWDQAVLLAAAQTGVLLVLAAGLPRAAAGAGAPEPRTLPYRAARAWGLVTWIPAVLLTLGWASGALAWRAPTDVGEVGGALLTTLALGALVGAFTLLLFTLVAYLHPHRRFERLLLGYLAPSPAITGFALLLAWPRAADGTWQLVRAALALTLLYFAPLYRWQVHASLSALKEQGRVARTLGAGPWRTLREITWPQAAPALLAASGLAAAWATGEFALSGLLLERTPTLPQLIAGHLAHYRWGEAQLLLVPLAVAASTLYAFYRRLARYVRS